jgi:legumain
MPFFFSCVKYRKSAEGSPEKNDARKELLEVMAHRSHVDNSVELIGNLLFGSEDGPKVLKAIRVAGKPLVDDWSCLKSTVSIYRL